MKINERNVQDIIEKHLDIKTISAEKFEHGNSRDTWRVEVPNAQNVVVSLFTKEDTHSYNPKALFEAQNKLYSEGAAIPKNLSHGKTDGGTEFIISEFVEGKSPKALNTEQIGAAAKAMAKFHAIHETPSLSSEDKIKSKKPTATRGPAPVDRYMEDHGADKNNNKLLEFFNDAYKKSDVKISPDQKRVIHGNIQPAHLIFDKEDKATIVGWNRMREGDTFFDTGTFIAKSIFLPEGADIGKVKSFINNYNEERPMSGEDADRLQNAVLARVVHTIAVREKLPEDHHLHTSYEKGIKTLERTKSLIKEIDFKGILQEAKLVKLKSPKLEKRSIKPDSAVIQNKSGMNRDK